MLDINHPRIGAGIYLTLSAAAGIYVATVVERLQVLTPQKRNI